MKRFLTFSALAAAVLLGCGDNSSSADESSSTPVTNFDGDGYQIADAYSIDEANHLLITTKNKACVYHSDAFQWEDTEVRSDTSTFKLIGDSLWIGPSNSEYDPDNPYHNYESLSLSSNHDGLYGQWTSTFCKRVIGESKIKCEPYGNMYGTKSFMTFTKDSAYSLAKYDSSLYPEDYGNAWHAFRKMSYFIDQDDIDSLESIGLFKQKTTDTFTINGQDISYRNDGRFNSTGLHYLSVYESNGKTCTREDTMIMATENVCKESNQNTLIDRDYEPGRIINSFSYSNENEFKQCIQEMLTESTRNILEELDSY